MAEIKTIFWDIGGVLLTNGWDEQQRARVLPTFGLDVAEYESRHEAANYKWERGLCTAREYFDQTVFYQPRNFTFEQLWSAVQAQSIVLHPGCFEILDSQAAYGIYVLATLNNESRELNAVRIEKFGLRDYFEFFICSGYINEMKPHPDIFRAALEIGGCVPQQTLFIDDRESNTTAAIAAGMNAIHFESPAQLKAALTNFGIQT